MNLYEWFRFVANGVCHSGGSGGGGAKTQRLESLDNEVRRGSAVGRPLLVVE